MIDNNITSSILSAIHEAEKGMYRQWQEGLADNEPNLTAFLVGAYTAIQDAELPDGVSIKMRILGDRGKMRLKADTVPIWFGS